MSSLKRKPENSVGIFGGTFDPVHLGHVNLAVELLERCQLDEVWFIPAHVSPFRVGEALVAPEHRLAMLRLAVEEIPSFKVLDIELRREAPSYTIDTLHELRGLYPTMPFALLMGEDVALGLPRWKEAKQIVKSFPLHVGCRRGSDLRRKMKTPLFPAEIRTALHSAMVPTALMDIEATQVRKRLKESLYCGHLLPSKVLDYIRAHQLYFH